MREFTLNNTTEYELTRPIADMAAFFDYILAERAVVQLTVVQANNAFKVVLEAEGRHYQLVKEAEGELVLGEVVRCVKLAVIAVFTQFTGEKQQLPWGILTGVRPDKLVHKLLDAGIAEASLPTYLEEHYCLPAKHGALLTEIVQKQKNILPDASRMRDAGIYIGIPYCPSRCSYCSFPAGIVPKDEESQQNFVNLIEQDVKNVVQLLSMHSLNVCSLYIGGGTPTSLNEKIFARLLTLVQRYLSFPAIREFTVEAGRPDCFSKEKLAAMEAAGVNRISVNPQTFHDKTLQVIGRKHTVADFYHAYEAVRASRIPIVNMDLIIGLPGENKQDILTSMQKAIALEPENLTIHTLTLKKSAPLFGSQMTLAADVAASLVDEGQALAKSRGLEPYYLYRQHYMLGHLANIGYAKPGTESLYNIQMMEERHPIIGVGPSSASKRPLADGHHLNKLNMPKNVTVYGTSLPALFKKRAELFT